RMLLHSCHTTSPAQHRWQHRTPAATGDITKLFRKNQKTLKHPIYFGRGRHLRDTGECAGGHVEDGIWRTQGTVSVARRGRHLADTGDCVGGHAEDGIWGTPETASVGAQRTASGANRGRHLARAADAPCRFTKPR